MKRLVTLILAALMLLCCSLPGSAVEMTKEEDQAARAKEALGWFDKGAALEAAQKHEQAIEAFSKALELQLSFPQAFVARGQVYAKLGQNGRALEDYNRAIYLDRQNAQAFNSRGALFVATGRNLSAVKDFTEAIVIDPGNSSYHENRAAAYARLKEFGKAIIDYSFVIAADPRNKNALAGRGAAYYHSGDDKHALDDLQKACSLGSKTGCTSLKALQKAKQGK
ncbi:MAG: tetratricopeptide repeat protein [Nitrospiraceae bacterium]|nr:tetratricopeptide repeat protein [Nitrospiraceae bacterium]